MENFSSFNLNLRVSFLLPARNLDALQHFVEEVCVLTIDLLPEASFVCFTNQINLDKKKMVCIMAPSVFSFKGLPAEQITVNGAVGM